MLQTVGLLLCVVVPLFAVLASASAPLAHGGPFLDSRIVGGSPVAIEYFPWQVSVTYYRAHRCGGTLISPLHVLTAAHCTYQAQRSAFGIRAGTSARNAGGHTRDVRDIVEYQAYTHTANDHDIAVVLMAGAMPLGPAVQPIALADRTAALLPGQLATISGWGDTDERPGSTPQQLHYVSVPVVDRRVCAAAYLRHARVTANMLCAGFEALGGRDACQGDSGGPLVAGGKLFGVVSFGIGCARANFPGVYTSVPVYRQWIDSVMRVLA